MAPTLLACSVLRPSLSLPYNDHSLKPTSEWKLAIGFTIVRRDVKELLNPICALTTPLVELCVAAMEFGWPLAFNSPATPHPPTNLTTIGGQFSTNLVLQGSAKLHIFPSPAVSLPKVDLGGQKTGQMRQQ